MDDLNMRVSKQKDCPFLYEDDADRFLPSCNIRHMRAKSAVVKTSCVGPHHKRCPLQQFTKVVVEAE